MPLFSIRTSRSARVVNSPVSDLSAIGRAVSIEIIETALAYKGDGYTQMVRYKLTLETVLELLKDQAIIKRIDEDNEDDND